MTTKILTVLALIASSTVAFAETPAMGICDANEVFASCTAVKEFTKHRDEVTQELQKKFSATEASLRSEYEKEMEKNKEAMKLGKKDEIEKGQKAFQAKVEADRKSREEAGKSIDVASADAENKVKAEILKQVTAVKNEKKLGTVLDKGAILVSDQVVDITSDVLERVNKNLPKVDVKINTPKA